MYRYLSVAGLINKTIAFTTSSSVKVFKIVVSNSVIGDAVDVNVDASGGALSIFRALLTHDGNSFYLSRLSTEASSSGFGYYAKENGNNTFYIKIAAWGRGTVEFKDKLSVSVIDVTNSFSESGLVQV